MKIELKTTTYGDIPLKLELERSLLSRKEVEIKAILETETGEVTFRISEDNLNKIKKLYDKE